MFPRSASRISRLLAAGTDLGPASFTPSQFTPCSSLLLHSPQIDPPSQSCLPHSFGNDPFGMPFGVRMYSNSGSGKILESGNGGAESVSDVVSSILDPNKIAEVVMAADSLAVEAAASDRWPIIAGLQHALEWVHVTTGLPWWASTILCTLMFRTITFPVALFQIKNTHKLSQARPETEKLVEEYQRRLNSGMDAQEARNWYGTEIGAIWKKYDCSPFKSMGTLLANGTLFVSFFLALRGLADAKVPSMAFEGAAWFTDLTVADPMCALPVISAATFLITVELGAADGMESQPETVVKRMKWLLRGLAVAFVPLTWAFPSSIFMYWIPSNVFSLTQNLLLKHPRVKKFMGLPNLAKKNDSGKEMVGKPVQLFTYNPTKSKRKKPAMQGNV